MRSCSLCSSLQNDHELRRDWFGHVSLVTASQEGRCGVQPANEKYDMAKRTTGGGYYGDSVELQGTGFGHALPAELQQPALHYSTPTYDMYVG